MDLNKVGEAKKFAVLQAQHEGCLGSYKSFESLFGNYLVLVIPSNGLVEHSGRRDDQELQLVHACTFEKDDLATCIYIH
jgi:hypothetical protein